MKEDRIEMEIVQNQQARELDDGVLVERIVAGEAELFEIIMRRYNQRLYRVARAVLGEDSEAEDVMQEAYVRAFRALKQFAGRAKFSTWLTRIAVNEALQRRRRNKRFEDVDQEEFTMHLAAATDSPEQESSRQEMTVLLEQAIAALPEKYRMVFVLREVEELSTEEAAASLELTEENVRIRLHRAKALLRRYLEEKAGIAARNVLPFHLSRCDRVVERVFERIRAEGSNDRVIG